jgi:heterodisulfide reductase subunit C/nitrate reductase gamma subunit
LSLFQVSFYLTLVVFLAGLIYRVVSWFTLSLGPRTEALGPGRRFAAGLKGAVGTLFSAKIGVVLKVFFLDWLLQRRILRESALRWTMHMLIFWGFMLLLLMHALERQISYPLFKDYSPTLNPFLFLRNLFGLMVIVGVGISVYRRFILKAARHITNGADKFAIIILAVVMLSGFMLEASKIVSHRAYQRMVEDYASVEDKTNLNSLELYWAERFGVASPNWKGPADATMLSRGAEVHQNYCASCHSRPQWALGSYGLSVFMRPFSEAGQGADPAKVLWFIHFLACFVGLAYLPFSRMFHVFATPLTLLLSAVMDERSDPANVMTRQIMELDGCTHCGTCAQRCSVGIWTEAIANPKILPSEKIDAIRNFARGKVTEESIKALQEGVHLCTNCYRCTTVCPAGINLQELWHKVREALYGKGLPEPSLMTLLSYYRGLRREGAADAEYTKPLEITRRALADTCRSIDMQGEVIDMDRVDRDFKSKLKHSGWGESHSYCFTCMTCTGACPIVRQYENPVEALGLTPHQIIRAAAWGLSDPIFKCEMLWSCLGCYQCQEACPQGVRVTDVLYQLKNMALARLNGDKAGRKTA